MIYSLLISQFFFKKLYREADLHEEKDRICRNLGAIKDEKILRKVLDFAISEEVRSQDSVFVIISVAALSSIGRDLAWEFFKNHWEVLLKRYEVCIAIFISFFDKKLLHLLNFTYIFFFLGWFSFGSPCQIHDGKLRLRRKSTRGGGIL